MLTFCQNIHSGVTVSVVVFLAERTFPFTDLEILDEIIPSTAGMTDLCGRKESVHLYNDRTVLFCDIFQYIHEKREAII